MVLMMTMKEKREGIEDDLLDYFKNSVVYIKKISPPNVCDEILRIE